MGEDTSVRRWSFQQGGKSRDINTQDVVARYLSIFLGW